MSFNKYLAVIFATTTLTGCKLSGEANGVTSEVTLKDMETDEVLIVETDGLFQFVNEYEEGDKYNVSILNSSQECELTNEKGVFGADSITNLRLDCVPCDNVTASPVCGIPLNSTDGQFTTYANECLAEYSKASILMDTECGTLNGSSIQSIQFIEDEVYSLQPHSGESLYSDEPVETYQYGLFILKTPSISENTLSFTLANIGCEYNPVTLLATQQFASKDNEFTLIIRQHYAGISDDYAEDNEGQDCPLNGQPLALEFDMAELKNRYLNSNQGNAAENINLEFALVYSKTLIENLNSDFDCDATLTCATLNNESLLMDLGSSLTFPVNMGVQ